MLSTQKRLKIGVNDLATLNPGLSKQWHPTKNGDFTPSMITPGSGRVVWWICDLGHEWETQINNRKKGAGCPVCANKTVLSGFNDLATLNPNLSRQWHTTKNGDLRPEKVSSKNHLKVWWLGDCGHEWKASIASRSSGHSCPICAGKSVLIGFNDLGSINLELSLQWHPSRNNDLTPSDVTANSKRKVWWKCEYKHEWEAAIGSRNKGNGCPICAGQVVMSGFNDLATLNPVLASQWHPTKNNNVTSSMITVGSTLGVWWVGNCGHEWKATVGSRTRGNGCPICAGKTVLVGFNDLATLEPNISKQWHPTKNGKLLPSDVTFRSKRRVWWKCEIGHDWETGVDQRDRYGCPVCSGKVILVGFNDLATTHPLLVLDWNHEKNGNTSPSDVSYGSKKKVWWKCKQGHEWDALIRNHDNDNGCPVCSRKRIVSGVNDFATTHPNLSLQWHPSKNGDITPSDVTYGSGRKFWWKCERGHEWISTVSDRTGGHNCNTCYVPSNISQIELSIFDALLMRYSEVVSNSSVPVAWDRNRHALCDITLPRHRIVIEYDGAYWHRNKCKKDESKTQALLDAGYSVIRIRETPLPFLPLKHDRLTQLEHHFKNDDVDSLVKKVAFIIGNIIGKKSR